MGKGFFKLRQVGIDQISLLDRHVANVSTLSSSAAMGCV